MSYRERQVGRQLRPVLPKVVVFEFVDQPNGSELEPENVETNEAGRASAEAKLGTPAGDQSVEARMGDANDLRVQFRLTALPRRGGGGDEGGGGGGNNDGDDDGDDDDDDEGKDRQQGQRQGEGEGRMTLATVWAVQIAPCVTERTGRLSLEQARTIRGPAGFGGLMRAVSILPLAFTAAVMAGCAADSPKTSNEETASRSVEATGVPDRDLTLQAPAMPAVEVASAVELSRPVPEPRPARRARISPKPAPAPLPDPAPEAAQAAQAALQVPTAAVAEVLAEPAPVEDVEAGAGRELAPGKTVTVIPASSGPSSAPEEPSWAPGEVSRGTIIGGGGGRGGTCRPRGGVRGIGIAGRIPIGVPGRSLR